MRVKLFNFYMTDFEEVYAVIDEENKRLHISLVNYSYGLTLDTTKDLYEEVEQSTRWGEQSFNQTVRKVARSIVDDLGMK